MVIAVIRVYISKWYSCQGLGTFHTGAQVNKCFCSWKIKAGSLLIRAKVRVSLKMLCQRASVAQW